MHKARRAWMPIVDVMTTSNNDFLTSRVSQHSPPQANDFSDVIVLCVDFAYKDAVLSMLRPTWISTLG